MAKIHEIKPEKVAVVADIVEKLKAELADTMAMCGAHSIDEISRDMIFGF